MKYYTSYTYIDIKYVFKYINIFPYINVFLCIYMICKYYISVFRLGSVCSWHHSFLSAFSGEQVYPLAVTDTCRAPRTIMTTTYSITKMLQTTIIPLEEIGASVFIWDFVFQGPLTVMLQITTLFCWIFLVAIIICKSL